VFLDLERLLSIASDSSTDEYDAELYVPREEPWENDPKDSPDVCELPEELPEPEAPDSVSFVKPDSDSLEPDAERVLPSDMVVLVH